MPAFQMLQQDNLRIVPLSLLREEGHRRAPQSQMLGARTSSPIHQETSAALLGAVVGGVVVVR